MIIGDKNISLLQVACMVGETVTVPSVKVKLEHPSGSVEEVSYSNCKCLDTRLSSVNLSDNINMFSKRKPIDTPNSPTEYSEWWKGTDGKCGIDIPTFTSIGDFDEISDFIQKNKTWVRKKPLGGQYSPYRLSYFSQYDSYAEPFFRLNLDGSPIIVSMDLETTLTIRAYSMINSSDTGLRWSDFNTVQLNLCKCYLGVYIVEDRASSPMELFCTSESTIDSTDSEIVISLNSDDTFREGDYYIYFFLSDHIIQQGSSTDPSTDGYKYYPIYTDNLKNYPIKMTYTTSFPIDFLITRVNEVASSDSLNTMSFRDISWYETIDSDSLTIGKYTLFKISVKNRKNSAITINKEDISIQIINHWGEAYTVTSSKITGKPFLYLTDSNLSPVNSVSVSASATEHIIVCIEDFIYGAGDSVEPKMIWTLNFGTNPEGYEEQDFLPQVTQDINVTA